MTTSVLRRASGERAVLVTELGDELGRLRLRNQAQLQQLGRSLGRHGQLEPLVAREDDGRLEVVDGFKRLHLARQLGWRQVRVRVLAATACEAKLVVIELHERLGLSAVEEGWLVRSLHREDRMSQGAIGERLGRHKTWVCRRLALVEQLDDTVQADVRLGLVSPRAAQALTALPRGNQAPAAQLIRERGLTSRQADRLVKALCEATSGAQATAVLEQWRTAPPTGAQGRDGGRAPKPSRSQLDLLIDDTGKLGRLASRLMARVTAMPFAGLHDSAAQLAHEQLSELATTLGALLDSIQASLTSTATQGGDR